jgi:LPS export ABC transporter protein LptC
MDYFNKLLNKIKSLDKKKKMYFLAIFLVIAIMSWAFISAGIMTCNFNRSQIQGTEEQQKVDADGIIITETKEGQKYFEIYGESGNYSNDHNIATLNNVVGNFYKNGEVAMSFQSSKGTYDEKEGIITLYDHTYIVLKDETSLLADKLTWSGSDKDTIAEGNVKIQKGSEMNALADKCVICSGYEKFKIIGKTKTSIYGNKEEN